MTSTRTKGNSHVNIKESCCHHGCLERHRQIDGEALAAKGAHVVIGARRTGRLEALAETIVASGGSVRMRALDVVNRQDTQAFIDYAKEQFGRVDVMVNNAGVMPLSPLASLKVDEWDRMIDVNIRGVLHGIAAVLPGMQAQGFGQIINISSIGGLRVTPTAAVYCATKFAVRAISDGLRQETDNIRVTVVCPGVTESELAESISDEMGRDEMKTFRKIAIPRMPSPALCRHDERWRGRQVVVRRQQSLLTSESLKR